MSKQERQATVETLSTAFKGSPNIYVTDFAGLEAVCRLESLGCEIPLAEIYTKITFGETNEGFTRPPLP